MKMDGKQRGNSAKQHNDILMCLDKGEHSVFVVTDLSAALDITDCTIHNDRLQNWLDISGTALQRSGCTSAPIPSNIIMFPFSGSHFKILLLT